MDEFNRGIYDYVIATDEVPELQTTSNSSSRERGGGGGGRGGGGGGGRKGSRKDKEYGVARGIDFQGWSSTGTSVYRPRINHDRVRITEYSLSSLTLCVCNVLTRECCLRILWTLSLLFTLVKATTYAGESHC